MVERLYRRLETVISKGTISGGVFSSFWSGNYGDLDILRPYGFTSTAEDGTDCAARVTGDAALVLGDLHASRPSTSKGEWKLYDKHGNTISSTSSGILIEDHAGNTITLNDTMKISAGGTVVEMSGGNVFLGVAAPVGAVPTATIKAVLLSGGTAKNVYAEKA